MDKKLRKAAGSILRSAEAPPRALRPFLVETSLIHARCHAGASSMSPAASPVLFRYPTSCEAALPSFFDSSSNLS
jgi:hypothetical protein